MATATNGTTTAQMPSTRDEAAELLREILTNAPQSEAALARALGFPDSKRDGRPETSLTHAGLEILASLRQAKRVPNTAGSRQGGWCRFDSELEAAVPEEAGDIVWPFDGVQWVLVKDIFVDEEYQRPLTSFAATIERKFDPFLFQTLMLSDRGSKNKPARYAVIDGNTRRVAAAKLGIVRAPAIIFTDLTPEDEADIFWRIQKYRKGVVSWYRFRAQMRSGNEESLAIAALAERTGYELGDRPGQIKAVTALEAAYRRDPETLERTLEAFNEAWGMAPEGKYIRGLHYFFLNYPVDMKHEFKEVNDEQLIRRLKINGPDDLEKKLLSVKDLQGGTGSPAKWMALAIQSAYLSRAKS